MASKLWRLTKLALLTLFAFLVLLAACTFTFRAYHRHEIARATAIDATKGIDEESFVQIGGIQQWIAIRGQDRANPVLLLLHGGPGVATSPYPRDVLFNWTKNFTLVLWDQRGSGKTYGRSGPLARDVTIERMAQDGIEVAGFLRQRLHKPKIIVLGLSFGSIVGTEMAKERPDLFYAYVGTGQMVNEREGEMIDYHSVVDKARTRGDQTAIRELELLGPPPYATQAGLGVQRKWARAYEPGGQSIFDILKMILFESDAGPRDLRDYIRGIADSQNHFLGETLNGPMMSVDMGAIGTDFAVPFFVFQGAEDDIAPPSLAAAYVARITAPQKKFVAIPNAGHTAMYTRSDQFLQLLLDNVYPLAR